MQKYRNFQKVSLKQKHSFQDDFYIKFNLTVSTAKLRAFDSYDINIKITIKAPQLSYLLERIFQKL